MQTALLPTNLSKEIDKVVRKFLWGSTISNKKIHLVAWETLCQKKDEGGLMIFQAEQVNIAYMTKLA